ncbi:MAG: hypothetical protein ABIW32_02700 [Terrimesophilobacter sp.]
MTHSPSSIRRFLGWRWWRGWRGWLVFAVVTAIVSTLGITALVRTFSDPPSPWSEYPGVPQTSPDQVVKNETVEELSPRVDKAMAEVRDAITAEFGFTWTPKGKDVVEYETNRFHGTSLLNTYDSVNWQTSETLRTVEDKERAVKIVSDVMERNGFGTPQLQNVPGPGAVYEFGGYTLQDQGRWVVLGQPPEVSRGSLQFVILDLSHDRTQVLADASSSAVESLGWEPEYLSISYHGDFMLKESDRAEFARRAATYAGHILPVPGSNTD